MSSNPSHEKQAFALILDTSSSALDCWGETKEIAENLYDLLAGSELPRLYVLGSATPISYQALRQVGPPVVNHQPQPCSLIAPIADSLAHESPRHCMIVVGNGEIFDLEDWSDDPRIGGCLLIRVGENSLRGKSQRIPEITPDQIEDKESLLSYFGPPTARPSKLQSYGPSKTYKWMIDPSGYPLIWVDSLHSFVHLFPVTKAQFEKFIAAGRQESLDDEWYSQILAMNPRASYRSDDIQTYEPLFMTGISTDEAIHFSRWLGREYRLLSAEDWKTCCEWFVKQPATSAPKDLEETLSRDARAIWGLIADLTIDRQELQTLRELSLMSQGILEWVIEDSGRYCGLGDPVSGSYQRSAYDPVHLMGPEPRRLNDLGFRLRTK